MGYDTRFTLKVDTGGDVAKQIKAHQALSECDEARYCLQIGKHDREFYECNEPGHWYKYDEDMRRISAEITGVLFTLTGDGEERKDIWQAFYLNGKGYHEKAVVTLLPFNKKKLT